MDFRTTVPAPLVVVTNREPYVDEKVKQGIRTIQKAGGVVSALDPLLQQTGGDWIAWGNGSADRLTSPGGQRMVPPKNPRYRLHRVYLNPEEIQGYYSRYANQGLWPLSHMLIERARFSRRAWQIYRTVNMKFARRVADSSPAGAWIFSHDYHLALLPGLVRRLRDDTRIAHFWHIPWPPFTIFRLCPQHPEILRGLLGADVLGFQTESDVDNFLEAVSRSIKTARIDPTRKIITWQNREVRVAAFPVSVDIDAIEQLASSARVVRWQRAIRRRLAASHRILGVSVDRADYTKGIIPRLNAIEEFFSRYPQWRGQVTFVQVVVPTRSEVAEYRVLYGQVEDLSRSINTQFGQPGWAPVITIRRSIDRPRLMGLFRAADFALISSLFDGMNLVAKEFVSAQVDNRGILLLSESAGAAQELAPAFSVNPLDPEGFASTLNQALTTPLEERRQRMLAMREHIHRHTIYQWLEDILAALADVSAVGAQPVVDTPPRV